MEILTENPSLVLPPSIATIGCFDGVHRGHRYLIQQVCEAAVKRGLHTTLITFPIHPRQVMQADYQPQLLSCLPQKTALLKQLQADYCLMLPFTHALSRLSAKEFMNMLHEQFNIQALLIGYDHRFGHNRSEGFQDYCRYGKELGMEIIQAQALIENGVSISSSIIRKLLKEGNVKDANHFLGYSYYLDGKVVNGYKVGRTLGFPTANLRPSCPDKLIPEEGVYAVHVYLKEQRFAGMLNIGHRPTLNNGSDLSIEVHILDFNANIYDQSMRIEFVLRIRTEQKFTGLNELIEQLQQDRKEVRKLLLE